MLELQFEAHTQAVSTNPLSCANAVICLSPFSRLLHHSLQTVADHDFHYPKSSNSSPMCFTQINSNVISNFQL